MNRWMNKKRLLTVMGGSRKVNLYNNIIATSPDLYYPLNDTSGITIKDYSGNTANSTNILSSGSFDADLTGWTPTNTGDGTIEVDTVSPRTGAGCLKITQGSSGITVLSRTRGCYNGNSYEIRFWTRGDGTNAGRYAVRNVTSGDYIVAVGTSTGVAGTEYTEKLVEFTLTGAVQTAIDIQIIFYGSAAAGGEVYFDDVTLIGIGSNFDGRLIGSGATLDSEKIGLSSSILFGGSDLININKHVNLATVWDDNPCTILVWAKPNFVFSEAQPNNYDLYSFVGINTGNIFVNYYDSSTKTLNFRHYANGTNIDQHISDIPTGWFNTLFVSSGTDLKCYFNGSLKATKTIDEWVAGDLSIGVIANAGQLTAFHSWKGNMAHVTVWFRELTADEIASVTSVK